VQEAKLSDFGDASPTNDGRCLDAGIKKCAWDKTARKLQAMQAKLYRALRLHQLT